MEAFQQPPNAEVEIDIEVLIGVTVSGQELLDSQGSRRMQGANQDEVTASLGDQVDSTENEGSDDDFTEFAIGLNQRQQPFPIDPDRLTRVDRAYPDQGSPPGEQVTSPVNPPGPSGRISRSVSPDV